MKNILKISSIIGILATSFLLILWILGVANTSELQEIFVKLIGVIGVLTVASILITFTIGLGEKK